jgi:hypothetical protein
MVNYIDVLFETDYIKLVQVSLLKGPADDRISF